MIKRGICLFFLVVFAFLLFQKFEYKKTKNNYAEEIVNLGLPDDYFPAEAGMRWTYQITVGKILPLYSRQIQWETDSGEKIASFYTGHYLPRPREKKVFSLVIGIIRKWGKNPAIAEIKVEKDELGVFKGAKRIFWEIIDDENYEYAEGGYQIYERITYPSSHPDAPPDSSRGMSTRTLMFSGEPGDFIEYDYGHDHEGLVFDGSQSDLILFTRGVLRDESSDSNFIEKTIFRREKGIIWLEQKIGNEVSMVWKLIDFSRGFYI